MRLPLLRWPVGRLVASAGAVLLGCGTDLTLYEAVPGDAGPSRECGTCEGLAVECGSVVNRCDELLACGSCRAPGSCGAVVPGRCGRPDDTCPTAPGEARLLATRAGFQAWPAALATNATEVLWTTAHPTPSTPGPSELLRVSKCGGAVDVLAALGDGDNLGGGQTVAVDDAFYWAVNPRGPNGTRSARVSRDDLGATVAFAEGIPGPCALAVDAARDRVLVAGCSDEPQLAAVPRAGGDVVRLAPDVHPGRRRVVVDGDQAYWPSREPPGIQALDLTDPAAAPRTIVTEPATPRDIAVHQGVVYWLRPTREGTGEEGAVLLRRPPGAAAVETLVTLGAPHRSLSAFRGYVYLVDDASPLRVDVETVVVERLPGPGGLHILAEPDGIYVARPRSGEGSDHQIWRVHRP